MDSNLELHLNGIPQLSLLQYKAMSLSAQLLDFAISLIDKIGYFGISLILIADNAGVPIPSEAILALSGAAARSGKMNIVVVLILGIVTQTIGSCLAYWIGATGGEKLVRRYGKYLLISMEDYDKTQAWFKDHGPRAIFISRLTPVVRTFMGFAAGGAKMDFQLFFWQTLGGTAIWTVIWTGIGYALGESWRKYYDYMHYVDLIVIAAVIILIARFAWTRLNKKTAIKKSKKG